jgi:hypothetical protein
VFLIGITFILPWLFFREQFDLLIKNDDLSNYTETARQVLLQRQHIVSYFPIVILILSSLTFISGIYLCVRGIRDWRKSERLKQEANQLANQISTQQAEGFAGPEGGIQQDVPLGEVNIINSVQVPINNLWILNHWGSDVASISDGKMIFRGKTTRLEFDGSHVNLANVLKLGKIYIVSCFTKSLHGTTGKFQLWCHDNIGIEPFGSENAIPYATPLVEGSRCNLRFEAKINTNLRIHLQYQPGEGLIEISDVRIKEFGDIPNMAGG